MKKKKYYYYTLTRNLKYGLIISNIELLVSSNAPKKWNFLKTSWTMMSTIAIMLLLEHNHQP